MSEIGESGAPPRDLGPLEALGRVAGVYYAPSRTAREIRDSPNWVFPLLLSIVLSFLLAAALFSRPEWKEALQKAMAAAPPNLGELEKVQLLKGLQVAAWAGALAAVVIGNLFLALLLWGLSVVLEGRPRFMTVFSLQLHAQMVTLIPQAIGLGFLLARKGSDLGSDETLPFSLAYFLPSQGVSPLLRGLATSADLFTFWYWALVLLGLPIVAGLPRKKLILPVLLLLFLGILVRAATFSMALAGP
jgi:hypothetical protein